MNNEVKYEQNQKVMDWLALLEKNCWSRCKGQLINDKGERCLLGCSVPWLNLDYEPETYQEIKEALGVDKYFIIDISIINDTAPKHLPTSHFVPAVKRLLDECYKRRNNS